MTDDRVTPGLTWPEGYDRTPASDRESYPGDLSVTRKTAFESIVDEIEAWGGHTVEVYTASQHYTDRPNIPHQHDKPDDPGVVAQYRREDAPADAQFTLPCDTWKSQRENARAIALYARRMRLAERCGVELAQSTHATARLPPGTDNSQEAMSVEPSDPLDGHQPHDVLDVSPDAPPEVVHGAARAKKKKVHPDTPGGSEAEFKRVVAAEEALTDE